MMDNSNIDNLTKGILAESKLELTNPHFSNLVMKKIRTVYRRQSIFQNIGLFFIRFITIDAVIFCLAKTFGIKIVDIASKMEVLSNVITSCIQTGFRKSEHLILIYIIILAIVIILLNRKLSSGYRYSSI
jgi:hypothetical protein